MTFHSENLPFLQLVFIRIRPLFLLFLEVVSKPQIRLKSKAQTDEKAQSRQRRDEQVHFEEVCNAAIAP